MGQGRGYPIPNGHGDGKINFDPSGMETCWGVGVRDWGDNICPHLIVMSIYKATIGHYKKGPTP